jgi:hypothetical protein
MSRPQTVNQLSDNDHKIYWTSEQYLKNTGASPEELIGGIVDGERDCGLDAVYVFANGICLSDDSSPRDLGRNARLDLVLLQVKDSPGFGEDPIDKLFVNLPRLLQFDRDEGNLVQFANSRVVESTRRFLNAYRELQFPEVQVFIAFASLRATDVHGNIREKATVLEASVSGLLGGCPVHVSFLTADELYRLARDVKVTTRELQLAENPISTDMAGGYVGVVRLDAYHRFITTPENELDTSLFEANVRDYEGETEVNQSIEETLAKADLKVDFWWLNNGVTIVADQVQLAGKLLQLQSPQIVNGLQTSTEIYKRGRSDDTGTDARTVLVKIIEAKDAGVRERIIRATNSQTSFGPSALRATDDVQRQIEDYLLRFNYYYERRRRQYYNAGKPMDRIVSIDGMGQALISILAQMPHVARATPSEVFDRDKYALVFSPDHPVQMYAAAWQLLRQCDEYLLEQRVKNPENFRFHLAMMVGVVATRKVQPKAGDIGLLENKKMERSMLADLFSEITARFHLEQGRDSSRAFDQLAKSEEVSRALLEVSRGRLRSPRQIRRLPRQPAQIPGP